MNWGRGQDSTGWMDFELYPRAWNQSWNVSISGFLGLTESGSLPSLSICLSLYSLHFCILICLGSTSLFLCLVFFPLRSLRQHLLCLQNVSCNPLNNCCWVSNSEPEQISNLHSSEVGTTLVCLLSFWTQNPVEFFLDLDTQDSGRNCKGVKVAPLLHGGD